MAESTLSLTFEDLGRSTAFHMRWGRKATEAEGLTAAQAANVEAANRAGYRDFLNAWNWEFKTPRHTMTLWATTTGTCSATGTTVTATAAKFHSSMIGHTILIESILNGTFDADTNWTKPAGTTIGSGVATAVASTGDLSQTVAPLLVGLTYRVAFTLTRTAGSILAVCGTASGTSRSASGTFTQDIVCTATTGFKFTLTGFSGTIDNVTVQALHTITAYTSSTVVTVAATATVTSKAFSIAADGVYRLPDDFGGFDSDEILFAANDSDERVIALTAEPLIVEAWQLSTNPLRPSQAAARPLSSTGTGQRYDLCVAAIPDVDYPVSFRYHVLPLALTTGQYPYGGMHHAETIRLACLASAEGMFNDEPMSRQHALYAKALEQSKMIDRRMRGDRLGISRLREGVSRRPEWERATSGGAYGVVY